MADVSVSYRQPIPFQSPFIVQPRQGVVEPRSEGAFKVGVVDILVAEVSTVKRYAL